MVVICIAVLFGFTYEVVTVEIAKVKNATKIKRVAFGIVWPLKRHTASVTTVSVKPHRLDPRGRFQPPLRPASAVLPRSMEGFTRTHLAECSGA